MNDPSMPPLPEELQSLLQHERQAPEPPGVRERLFARLGATLPAVGPTPPPARLSTPASPASSVLRQLGLHTGASAARIATAFVLGGLAGSAITAKIEHRRTEQARPRVVPPPPEPTPAPAAPEPPPVFPPSAPTPALAPPVRAPPSTRTRNSAPAPNPAPLVQKPSAGEGAMGSGDLARQRLLLEQVRVALGRGDASAALAGLAEHERQFPHSQLDEERELLSLQALQRAGDYAEVRRRAAIFEERFPRSMFIPMVHSVLEQLP